MTIKLKEFTEKYGDIEVNEKELKDLLGIKDSKLFIPKLGEEYWFINIIGKAGYNFFYNDPTDHEILKYNIVYRTEEEAKFARDKRAFMIQVERDFAENSDEIDWNDNNQKKYFMYFNNVEEVIETDWWAITQYHTLVTTNKEWLDQYIKDNDSDIKKYIFGIKENRK